MSRKKGLNKSKVGFSIDNKIINDFNLYCQEHMKNKSSIVNNLLLLFLKENVYSKEKVKI